jgi:hypothetical protein
VYSQAKQRICFRPDEVELLGGIYENPTYYSGYVLFNYPGSLNMKGDVTAEQNHSYCSAIEKTKGYCLKAYGC